MPRPFVAYLRVYEPLSSFDAPLSNLIGEALASGRLDPAAAGERERELWFRSQFTAPVTALPGEFPDGSPRPISAADIMVLDSAEVAPGVATVGKGPLVCPLDLRARCAAAMVGFLATASPVLRDTVLTASPEALREQATRVLSELPAGAVHVVSTTWTVPLPWFVITDPAHRHLVLAPREDARRRVAWRVPIGDAMSRVERARVLAQQTFGDDGPTKVLEDTGRWLEHFNTESAVELDYGGLVQLLDDDELRGDTSAEDVHAIVTALERGDGAEIAVRFEKLRDFWSELALRERFS